MVTQTDATATVTELRQMTMFAPMIQINFQASDLAEETSPTADSVKTTETASASAAESPTIASGASTAETSGASGNTDAGLTGGAMIGVIVGVVAGGLGLLTLVLGWIFWRRRRGSDTSAAAEMPAHAPYQEVRHQYQPGWGHTGVYELEASQSSPAELDAVKDTPAEMPADLSGEAKVDYEQRAKDGYQS